MFKTFIEQKPYLDSTEIYFIKENNGKRYLAKRVQLEFVEIEEGLKCESTIELNGFAAHSFLNSMAEALDKNGIKTDKDAKIEGTLDATKYHLEDLRILLKLK